MSPPTSISVRPAYVQKDICEVNMKDDKKNEEENEYKNDEENIRHKSEEKEEEEKERGGGGEGKQQTVKEKNQNSLNTPGADLILVGRVDGTVDLYQVQIP